MLLENCSLSKLLAVLLSCFSLNNTWLKGHISTVVALFFSISIEEEAAAFGGSAFLPSTTRKEGEREEKERKESVGEIKKEGEAYHQLRLEKAFEDWAQG